MMMITANTDINENLKKRKRKKKKIILYFKV